MRLGIGIAVGADIPAGQKSIQFRRLAQATSTSFPCKALDRTAVRHPDPGTSHPYAYLANGAPLGGLNLRAEADQVVPGRTDFSRPTAPA